VVEALRSRHYSRRTEEAYLHWIRRFLAFHGGIHPRELAESDVNRFLTHLAISENVAAPTQNQALAAVLFPYHFPIKCSGTDYTWTGMLRKKENTHTLETTKNVNSTPLEAVIVEKADALMVDYRHGTLLYSRVFTNAEGGIQNAMSFVATCKNY
jgi:site-specific recombinase XerD